MEDINLVVNTIVYDMTQVVWEAQPSGSWKKQVKEEQHKEN